MASPPSPPLRVEGVEAFNRHDNKIQLILKLVKPSIYSRLTGVKGQAEVKKGLALLS